MPIEGKTKRITGRAIQFLDDQNRWLAGIHASRRVRWRVGASRCQQIDQVPGCGTQEASGSPSYTSASVQRVPVVHNEIRLASAK